MNLEELNSFLLNNSGKLKGCISVFALLVLIGPFSGDFSYYTSLIFALNVNWYEISDNISINPIIFTSSAIFLQISHLAEFLFPRYWGFENTFFLRFILKLPGFLLLIFSGVLLRKLFIVFYPHVYAQNDVFFLHLFNLTTLYSVIVLGTNEIFPIALFLISFSFLSFYIWVEQDKNFLVISAIASGLAFTFSVFYIILIFCLYLKLTNREKIIHVSFFFSIITLIHVIWGFFIGDNYLGRLFESTFIELSSYDVIFFLILGIQTSVVIYLLYTSRLSLVTFILIIVIILLGLAILTEGYFVFTFFLFKISLYSFLIQKFENLENQRVITIIITYLTTFLGLVFYMVLVPVQNVIYLELVNFHFFNEIIMILESINVKFLSLMVFILFLILINGYFIKIIIKESILKLKK